MSQTTARNLVYLFDRPSQPIFRAKGEDANIQFDIPTSYYTERYRPIASQVTNRLSSDTIIPIQEHPAPDISIAMQLNKRANFSLFNESHRECATQLINTLMGIRTLDEFMAAACYIQQRVNPYLYIYALSVAILHRTDTRGVPVPSQVCTFPELYVDSVSLAQAREEGAVVEQGSNRIPVEIPRDFSASNLDEEHRIAYFREDIGINLHHWHWHLVYPFDGPLNIVQKDRRGELFYYMHQQIIARYNYERLCNSLPRVIRLSNLREAMKEAYFPKLDTLTASRIWPPRQANAFIKDLNREADQVSVDIQDLERWTDRIFEAIHKGYLEDASYQRVILTENEGINLLGNIIESSILSTNRNLYGNLHNHGHNLISYCHDPDNRYLETFGVMGDSTTAMRDPIFYRWHAFINDIFMEHKHTLPSYTTQQLNFDGVRVTAVEVRSDGSSAANIFETFWQRSQVDFARGLDFSPRGPVYAAFTHLQHTPFSYRITVENGGAQRMGTVRIFMAPRFDERGTPFLFRDQKNLFIELDKFTVNLRVGSNTITRNSSQSSVTIPFDQSFRDLSNRPADGTAAQEEFNFCGCGWPDHMLIPKGTPDGLVSDLFVMVSNFQTDRVEGASSPSSGTCDDAVSFCGLRNSKYPDAKHMGFPFDRMPRTGVSTLRQFLTPNMLVQEARVRFEERVVNRPTPSTTTTSAGQGQTQSQTQRPAAQGQTQSQTQRSAAQGQSQPSRRT